MLPWIRHHFPKVPIVLILRHPCAVALSRSLMRWNCELHLRELISQESLVRDYLEPFVEVLNRLTNPFEKNIAVWCIENYVPIRALKADDALVVFYESLALEPERELRRIGNHLNLGSLKQMRQRVPRPSSQTRGKVPALISARDRVSSWRSHITPAMMEDASTLLNIFGLSGLYGPDGMPSVSPDELLGSSFPIRPLAFAN